MESTTIVEKRRRGFTGALILTAVLLAAGVSSAQTGTVVAEGLFREGRELMDKGDIDAACLKFAESQRIEASSGTLLNLAACHAKQGKVASAWAEYLAAARLAQSQNRPERVEEAKTKAAELAPKLSHLRVLLAEKVPGIEVKLDDVTLQAEVLGSKIPVDPGERTVTISAPGHKAVTMKVTIGAERDSQTLNVPKLEVDESGTAPPPPPDDKTGPAVGPKDKAPPAKHPSPPVLAYAVGGVGVVALGVGTAFAFMARSAYKDAESACPTHKGCSSSAMDSRNKADTRANIANIGVGLGLVGVAAGVVLLVTHDSGSEKQARSPLRVSPYVSRSQVGVAFTGVSF
jgi:hypothetical protein